MVAYRSSSKYIREMNFQSILNKIHHGLNDKTFKLFKMEMLDTFKWNYIRIMWKILVGHGNEKCQSKEFQEYWRRYKSNTRGNSSPRIICCYHNHCCGYLIADVVHQWKMEC
jgi:tRNA U38,U39,U40 pseudouridine synthase TruA